MHKLKGNFKKTFYLEHNMSFYFQFPEKPILQNYT